LFSLLFSMAGLLLTDCDLLLYYEDNWELKDGKVRFTNSTVNNDVKFAAFYIDTPGGNLTSTSVCVSKVVDLNQAADADNGFTFGIDMSAYEPENGDEVHLYLWEDTDNDDVYDDGEEKSICIPQNGCPVFNGSSLAVFFFISNHDDYADGWYLNAPGGITAIKDVTLTGALIVNNSSL
jgi:hypothetical protein